MHTTAARLQENPSVWLALGIRLARLPVALTSTLQQTQGNLKTTMAYAIPQLETLASNYARITQSRPSAEKDAAA
jgi:hypothetical protein